MRRKQTDQSIEWRDITDFRADFFGKQENRDSVRKGFLLIKDYINEGWIKPPDETQLAPEAFDCKIRELKKERQKLSDSRIEYNRLIREESRKESFLELVGDVISKNVTPITHKHREFSYNMSENENSLLCHLTDLHTGINIDNYFNKFDERVLKDRINLYENKILDIRNIHHSSDCYIVIGEIVSGIIHNNLRIQNNMDLIEQFKYVCELISGMLAYLSDYFQNIHVYVTPGNHSRITQKKEDSLTGENLDILLPFYLNAKLNNIKNIHIHDNKDHEDIAIFTIYGNYIFASHGDKDSPATVVQNFTLMFDVKPDIILLGHRHLNGLTTVYDTKVIESGCVSGSDAFSMSIRKVNRPEQTVSVIDNAGLVCLYDIQLD